MKSKDRPKPVPSYRLHWFVVLVVAVAVVGGILVGRNRSKDATSRAPVAHAAASTANWFLLVRCPEMPMEAGSAEEGRARLKEWIDAARDAGFHPLAFADVLNRLRRGQELPDKSLVLMFDPAYRKTVEQILPTLESLHVPALWVTRSPGRIRADRRFVTGHARRTFSAEPLWDFAVGDDGDSFVLEKASAGRSLPRVYEWQPDLGLTGVNAGNHLTRLNRLHANARWSPDEFVNRLKADVPLRHRSGLSVRPIQDRMWGVLLPEGKAERFDLKAPLDRRFCSVAWQGTRGVNDLELDLSINSWFGEAWVFLRSSHKRGDRIRVGLLDGKVRVLQELDGAFVEDREEEWSIRPGEGWRLKVVLQGDTLCISSPANPDRLVIPAKVPGTAESVTEFSLYDRIHGAAFADGVQLTAIPLQIQDARPPNEEMVAAPQVAAQDTPAPAAN